MPAYTIKLNGHWQFKQYPEQARRMSDLDKTEWDSTEIPNSLYDSLIEIGKIEENDLFQNPEKYHHLSNRCWVFRKTFDVPPEVLECDLKEIVFEGLDTITSIWLNDKLITRTGNMFIPHRLDVTKHLKPKENKILVKFEPAEPYARKMMNRYTRFDKSKIINPWRAYIRKAQFQFGWDFCPPLPGCGIFRDVKLEGTKKARLDDIYVRTINLNKEAADLKISVALKDIVKDNYTAEFNLTYNDKSIASQNIQFTADSPSHSVVLNVPDPKLWYPAGYGEQNLYNLRITLKNGENIIEKKNIPIGIKTVCLDRTGTKKNQNFRIIVNDVPIHIRGANWVPPSVFVGSSTKADYKELIESAAEANFNMLRVWGGGIYESDYFYQLCTEKGIMVWQDFMFACSYYPDRDWFFEKINTEAATIIKQLRNHPSLCIWCGNNEIDWMHHSRVLGSKKKFHGKSIFHKIIPALLEELDSDRPCIPSTPIGTSQNHLNSADNGAIHNWNFWHNYAPVCSLQCPLNEAPRFVTEFGIQSPASIQTINKICPDIKNYYQQEFQKHNFDPEGEAKIQRYISEFFPNTESFDKFIYFAQLAQARAVKNYVERLRAAKERNSGVLFWQFNEPAFVTCWSAIDFRKNPKALLYYARRFYKPRTVIAVPEKYESLAGRKPAMKTLYITAVNDTCSSFTGTVNCRLEKLTGEIIDKVSLAVSVQPFCNSTLIKMPKGISFPEQPEKSLLHLSLESHQKTIAENFYFFLPDKQIDFPKPKIEINTTTLDSGQSQLIIKSDTFVKDFYIQAEKQTGFSDNFFDLQANKQFTLKIPAGITSDNITYNCVNNSI
jgi:beta-mannosidase